MPILQLDRLAYVDEIINTLPSRRKNLRVILRYQDTFLSSDMLPHLIGLNFIDPAQLGVPATFRTFSLEDLMTLTLHVKDMVGMGNTPVPRLRHLSIDSGARPIDSRPLLQWLRAAGSHLITLFWAGRASDGDFLTELWDLCPQVRRLQLPRGTKWTPPPQSRSLDLLRVDFLPSQGLPHLSCSMCHRIHVGGTIQFEDCVPQLALVPVSSLTIMDDWQTLLSPSSSFKRRIAVAHCMKLRVTSYGITMLDKSGCTFEDAVVSWLEVCLSCLEVTTPEWLDF